MNWRDDTTDRDLTLAENVKQARYELDRAGDDGAQLATWARKWARPACLALDLQEDRSAEVEIAEKEATEAEEALAHARSRCEDASKQLENVLDLIEEGEKARAQKAVVVVQELLDAA